MNTGWECPRCRIINAPFMSICGGLFCVPQIHTIITDSTTLNAHVNCTCPNCVPEKYAHNTVIEKKDEK